MKVFYFAEGLWQSGGTERVLTTKLNWLAEHSDSGVNEVGVVLDNPDRKPFFELSSRVKVIANSGDIVALLEEHKPDVAVGVNGSAVDVLPNIKDGSRKVLEIHYARGVRQMFVRHLHRLRFRALHLLKMHWLQWKEERLARKYDTVVGLTAWDVERWGSPRNMTYVHNPLSFRSERKATLKAKRIISVGSLTPVKGMDRLIEAFALVVGKFPNWRLDIYGEGQEKYWLDELIIRYGLEERIGIHPYSPRVHEHLIESSVYAFPSRSDGFGLVITEAMECGLPVVAFDSPCGPREILTPDCGILVADGDIAGFASALSRLMESEDLRREYGGSGIERAKDFHPDVIMLQWVKVFGNIRKTQLPIRKSNYKD